MKTKKVHARSPNSTQFLSQRHRQSHSFHQSLCNKCLLRLNLHKLKQHKFLSKLSLPKLNLYKLKQNPQQNPQQKLKHKKTMHFTINKTSMILNSLRKLSNHLYLLRGNLWSSQLREGRRSMCCLNTSRLKMQVPLTASLNLSNDSKARMKTSFTSQSKSPIFNSKTSLKMYPLLRYPLKNSSLEAWAKIKA